MIIPDLIDQLRLPYHFEVIMSVEDILLYIHQIREQ